MQQPHLLDIENFKAFGEKASFHLAPLTLLYGVNSTGKSSFLHALLYLHDLVLLGNADVKRPHLGGDLVDLGGYTRFLNWAARRGTGPVFRIHWKFGAETPRVPLANRWLGLELQVRPGSNGQVALLQVDLMELGHGVVASLRRDRRDQAFRLHVPSGGDGQMAGCPGEVRLFGANMTAESSTGPILPGSLECAELLKLLQALEAELADWLRSFVYLGPLRAYPARGFRSDGTDTGGGPTGERWWHELATDTGLRDRLNSALAHFAGNEKLRFSAIDWILSRYVDDLENRAAEVMRRIEDDLALASATPALDEVRTITKARLEEELDCIGQQLRSAAVGTAHELAIQEAGSNILASHRDFGMGYSQILPVLASSLGLLGRTILIEQPELHAHPRMQCDLADIFLRSSRDAGNTFIIETHSEHILLRVLRRIRNTNAGTVEDGRVPVAPEDASVLWLRRARRQTTVVNKPLRADGMGLEGEVEDEFFGERFVELTE